MSKSQNIDSETCQSCGKCCLWYAMAYDKSFLLKAGKFNGQSKEEDLTVFSELQRYLELGVGKIYIIEYEDNFSVILDFPCKNLEYKNGKYSCRTYNENRPLACERYPYKFHDCERFETPINTFRNSAEFLKRVEELSKVRHT
jgi:hypothetical protein